MLPMVLKALSLAVLFWSQMSYAMLASHFRRPAMHVQRAQAVQSSRGYRPAQTVDTSRAAGCYSKNTDSAVVNSKNSSKLVAASLIAGALILANSGSAESLPSEAYVKQSLDDQCKNYHEVFDGIYAGLEKESVYNHNDRKMWQLENRHIDNLIEIFRFGVVYARDQLTHDTIRTAELKNLWKKAIQLSNEKRLSPLEFSNLNIELADILAVSQGEYSSQKRESFRIQDRCSHMDSLTEQLGRFIFFIYGDVEIGVSEEVKHYSRSNYPVWMVPVNASARTGTWNEFDTALYKIPDVYGEEVCENQKAISAGYAISERLRSEGRNNDANVLEAGLFIMMRTHAFSSKDLTNSLTARLNRAACREREGICIKPDNEGYFEKGSRYFALKEKWDAGAALPSMTFDDYWKVQEDLNGRRGNISEVIYYERDKRGWESFLLNLHDAQGKPFLAIPTENYREINLGFERFWLRFQELITSQEQQ